MTYQKYQFTAFTEADLLQGVNGKSIGCGDTFVMPTSASVCMTTYDNDRTLSGDTCRNENANDHSGQKAIVDGARVGSQMYAESYHVLKGSDGKTYYLIEIEVEGHNAPGMGDDYFTFYGAVPPAGVTLDVVNTCNVRGNWVDFKCLDAGSKAPANTPPTFTNVPSDGIICVDENTSFVIDLAASDADGDSLTYSIVGGADAGAFTIDAQTGELTFTASPDYEAPTDGNGNNVYDVTVMVSDGNGGTETKAMWIKVKDVDEGGNTCIVVEAEDMQLCGYRVEDNGNASGGQVVKGSIGCWSSASTTFTGADGQYDLELNVLDENDGQGWIYIYVNGHDVSGPIRLNADDGGNGVSNSTFRTISIDDLNLNQGDTVTVWGYGQGCEFARIDNIKFCQDGDPMTAELGDRVWFDADKDGIQDAGEAGIAGVTVLLKDAAGNTLATTTTDANGDYLFSGLAAGDYKVCVVPANGLAFTGQDVGNDAADSDVDATGMTGVITLAEGESNLTVDAGLVDPGTASVSGTYFCDENDNDVQDAGEATLAGQTVWLLDGAGNIVATTTTDGNGDYSFTGLDAGQYCVRFDGNNNGGKTFVAGDVGGDDTVDSDVVSVGGAGNGNTAKFNLSIGENKTNVDAGVEDPGTAAITGRYFCDENDNDVDDGEPGIVGATVELLDAAGAVVGTTTTDGNGDYAFTGLGAGTYSVRFAPDTSGKTFVAKDAGSDDGIDSDVGARGVTDPITVAIGETSTDNDAGVEDPGTASLAGRVFCDDNNNDVDDSEPGVGGVTVTLLTAAGAVVATATTAADGSYSFTGLGAGDYKVMFDESTAGGKTLVGQDAGSDDTVDSDADASGMTGVYTLNIGDNVTDVDAGVENTNTDPTPADDAGKFCADLAHDIDLLFNDTDADGDILSVTSISDADETVGVGGTLTLASGATATLNADGTVTYDGIATHSGLLVGDEFNEETISYTVSDGNGGTGTANLDVTVCGAKATLQMICNNLPAQVDMTITIGGTPADYQISVVDDPNTTLDDGLASAIWQGACIDFNGLLVTNQQITANIYGPCDFASLPAGLIANPQNLDNIGWLINQGIVGSDDGNGGLYQLNDLQEAVWILSDSTTSNNADAIAIANMALSAGEGWVAQDGDLVPIVFDPVGPIDLGGFTVTDTQTFIMGVDWDALAPDCIC